MLNFTRFAALAFAVTFAQLPLGGASSHCASHGDAAEASAMEHMAMPPIDGELHPAQVADEAGCDDCTGSDDSQPCGHSAGFGGCMHMSSCATASAEQASAALNTSAAAMRVIITHVLAPASPSLAQDTPPPRV